MMVLYQKHSARYRHHPFTSFNKLFQVWNCFFNNSFFFLLFLIISLVHFTSFKLQIFTKININYANDYLWIFYISKLIVANWVCNHVCGHQQFIFWSSLCWGRHWGLPVDVLIWDFACSRFKRMREMLKMCMLAKSLSDFI